MIIFEHFHCFCFGNLTSVNLLAFFADFLHLFLDCCNCFVVDDIIAKVNIIIETFFTTGPTQNFACGYKCFTACAITCAQEWLSVFSLSSSLKSTMINLLFLN